MISKELLSEVLGYPKNIPYGNEGKAYKLNIVSSPYINENGKPNDIYFQTDAPGLGVNLINVYELAHKCKGWAVGKDWDLYLAFEGDRDRVGCELNHLRYGNGEFFAKTEIEVIFKVCQFILDNKN